MKKIEIIKSSDEFTKIIKTGKRVSSNSYSIYYIKNNKDNRYGISVPTKTGHAVVRNKVKRQTKNIIDNNKKSIQTGYDYVIIIRKGILDLSYQELEKDLVNLMSKIGDKIEQK